MIREIKFRGWVKSEKKMYGSGYGGWVDYIRACGEPDINGIDVEIIDENGEYQNYNFDEIELMQYTGLKDKNGKEIYEGDIVDLGTGAEVYWGETDGAWIVGEWLLSEKVISVIGNIHENPELIKK